MGSQNDDSVKKYIAISGVFHFFIVLFLVLALLAVPNDQDRIPFKFCAECITVIMTYDNFRIPVGWHGDKVSPSTTYACTGFKFDMTQQYHIVEMDPIVTTPAVHHMILYTMPWDATGTTFDCLDMPDSAYPLFIWGAGAPIMTLPPTTGIKVGKDTSTEYVVLQIHFTNPELKENILDSSGVRIKMTTHLRQNDIGYLLFGTGLNMRLPPQMPLYEISGNCSHEWTESLPFPITVFSIVLHAHLLGRAIWTEVWRDGKFVDWLGESALVYDFNKQSVIDVDPQIVIMPGDDIITHCIYDTSTKTNVTHFGFSTENEMCLTFVLYYPKLDAMGCLSNGMAVNMNSPTYSRPKSKKYP